MTTATRLLVVDDNAVDRKRVRRIVGDELAVEEAATSASALERCSDEAFDCVLLDFHLPDTDGLDTLVQLVSRGLPVVMLTGQGDERVAVEAMKRGAQDYIVKSELDGPALRRSIANAMEKAQLRRHVETQRGQLRRQLEVLREERAKLGVILTQLPAVTWTTDRELRFTSVVGTRVSAPLDEASALGRRVPSLLESMDGSAGLIAAHRDAMEGRHGVFELELAGRALEGRTEPLRDDADAIVGVIGVALDVTETRHLEEQFRHAQKMEALGQLAGGVAHDFNNLLTAIVHFTQFAKEEVPAEHGVQEDLAEVLSAARRGADLVQKLLAFSRRRTERPRPVDLNELVSSLLPMLRRLVNEDVAISVELAPELSSTLVDRGGVEQILVNLIVNARDAMPRGGAINISTREVTYEGGQTTAGRALLEPGDYVVLAVSDDGHGIPPDLQERIFEPFFTTKDVGSGTGLGLSTCYGIARHAGGGMGLYSEVGSGTTFRVYLPASEELQSRASEKLSAPTPLRGHEHLLVLEDDDQVRRAVVRVLKAFGYRVLAASDADEAERLATERGRDVALILSDVVMPGSSGPEAVARLRGVLPEARMLYMSGYTNLALRSRALIDVEAPVLEKPFTGPELGRAVRRVLDAEVSDGPAPSDSLPGTPTEEGEAPRSG